MWLQIRTTYLIIQVLRFNDVIVDDFDLKATCRGRRQILDEFPELRSANSISTVDSDRSIEFSSPCSSFERGSHFLVVPLLCWFSIFIGCVFRVQTTGDVMELWCSQQLVVGELRTRRLKSCKESRNETRT